ncbi:MAG TPA: LysR family transcriptional regulator [Thermoleophilaceae bacterium]
MALDVRRLRLLRELSARGTIAATADALSYTPSAVSQQLSALEREAGAELLERRGRRVRLTDAGHALVARADEVLAALERAEAELEAGRRDVRGTVRIASFPSAARAVLPGAAGALAARHPDLVVHCSDAEPAEGLAQLRLGELDLVLSEQFPFVPPRDLSGFECVDLFEDPLDLAVGPGHEDAPADFGRLEGVPFIGGHPGTSCHMVLFHACRAQGYEPTIVGSSNDYAVVLALVGEGLGVSLAPAIAQDLAPAGVSFKRFRPRLHRRVYAAVRAGTLARPAIAAMLDELRAFVARRGLA